MSKKILSFDKHNGYQLLADKTILFVPSETLDLKKIRLKDTLKMTILQSFVQSVKRFLLNVWRLSIERAGNQHWSVNRVNFTGTFYNTAHIMLIIAADVAISKRWQTRIAGKVVIIVLEDEHKGVSGSQEMMLQTTHCLAFNQGTERQRDGEGEP